MERMNAFQFYELGQQLQKLKNLKDEMTVKESWYDLAMTRISLERLQPTNASNLRACRESINKLTEAITTVIGEDFEKVDTEGDKKLHYSGYQIRQMVESLEKILAAELKIADTYWLAQKGAFSTNDLLENAIVLLPNDTQQKLSDTARTDLAQGARCLVLDSPTACAFHLMRCVESVLLAYYQVVMSKTPEVRNWGAYLSDLDKSGHADEKVTGLFRHIKDHYRNPVSHPDEFVASDEAFVLLSVTIGTIVETAKHLPVFVEPTGHVTQLLATK